MAETGCKIRQISAWFKDHESLGYAMFVQSSLDQISVHRQTGTRAEPAYDEESALFWDYGDHGLREIKTKEGILISAFRAQHHQLPTWNKINGPRQRDENITPGGYNLLVTATGKVDSLLVSRKTVRQLSTRLSQRTRTRSTGSDSDGHANLRCRHQLADHLECAARPGKPQLRGGRNTAGDCAADG